MSDEKNRCLIRETGIDEDTRINMLKRQIEISGEKRERQRQLTKIMREAKNHTKH